MSTRRNVKSDAEPAADAHERGRDYLGLGQLDLAEDFCRIDPRQVLDNDSGPDPDDPKGKR